MSKEHNKREKLWKEAAGHCVYCGHKVSLEEMEVDHIVPRSLGGDNSLSNLACACPHCNGLKGNKFPEEFIIENMTRGKLDKFRKRLDSLVAHGHMQEQKAKALFPFGWPDEEPEEEPEKENMNKPEEKIIFIGGIILVA